tara:strand:+ start:677 stop:991 length:315 start_codon:yes stop_codon:yes gene_type:complete
MRIKMQDIIKQILLTKKHCRDNDVYLLYEIWNREFAKLNLDINNMHLVPTLKMWSNKLISHPSAIMRARRKVQEEHKETRGKLWNERHKQETVVQQDLGYNVEV